MKGQQPGTDWGRWLRRARKAKDWTQSEMAEAAGVKRTTYANYESGASNPPETLIAKLMNQGIQPPAVEISTPLFPYGAALVPIPHGPAVPCSDWSDPLETDYSEFVEVDALFAGKGRFACKIIGDSMYELLWPGDLCVWQSERVPKLGQVVIARNQDNAVTCAQLQHDGENFVLHKLNPKFGDATAESWEAIGYLIAIIREQGSKRVTVFDPNGIRP